MLAYITNEMVQACESVKMFQSHFLKVFVIYNAHFFKSFDHSISPNFSWVVPKESE